MVGGLCPRHRLPADSAIECRLVASHLAHFRIHHLISERVIRLRKCIPCTCVCVPVKKRGGMGGPHNSGKVTREGRWGRSFGPDDTVVTALSYVRDVEEGEAGAEGRMLVPLPAAEVRRSATSVGEAAGGHDPTVRWVLSLSSCRL